MAPVTTKNWAKRLDLPPQPRIRYTRKSTEEKDKQIASHDQQYDSMDRQWGKINTEIWFRDDFTGTTFDRPQFREMAEFCRINKQPKGAAGLIEVYDMSRWGRILTDGDEDPYAVMEKLREFERWGWTVKFLNIQPTGDVMLDFLQQGMHSIMAAQYSKKLSRDTRRGKAHFYTLESGARWMGGEAPLGTMRVDPNVMVEVDGKNVMKPLGRKERATRGGSILIPNPEELPFWLEGAKMLLNNAAYSDIAEYWNNNGVRTEWGRRWEYTGVKFALANPALMGELHVNHQDPKTGEFTVKVYKAGWEPIVDPDFFKQVAAEVARRSADNKIGPRAGMTRSLLSLVCARCGLPWYASKTRTYKRQGGRKGQNVFTGNHARAYYHVAADHRTREDWKERVRQSGCKHWKIDADALEAKIVELIFEARTSDEFVEHLNRVITERGDLESQASKQRETAERKLKQLQSEQAATLTNMAKATARGMDDKPFWDQLERLNAQINEVRQARDEALELEKVANNAWETVQDLISETKNLKSIWATADFDKRRQIIDWWVRQILIVVDHPEGERRAKAKYALVYLRTAPTEGIDLMLDEGPNGGGAVQVGGENTGTRTHMDNLHAYIIKLPLEGHPGEWMAEARWSPVDVRQLHRFVKKKALQTTDPVPYRKRVILNLDKRWRKGGAKAYLANLIDSLSA